MPELFGHIEPVGGAAGDMLTAALLEALPQLEEAMRVDLAAVVPDGMVQFAVERRRSGALSGTHFSVVAAEGAERLPAGYEAFRGRIADAALEPAVKALALSILERLGRAEALVHAVSLEHVHFHEIADWDTLVDATAAASLAVHSGVTRWSISPLPHGGGMVETMHGLLPVPAPATQRLLEGFAWRDDGVSGERVTPTGAAILSALVTDPTAPAPAGRLRSHGYGLGTRDLGSVPNVVRVSLYAADESAQADDGCIAVLSFEVDDMTGEEIALAAERLRATPGVRDLSLAALTGKKNRVAHGFQLLVDPALAEDVGRLCLFETSTLGLRIREERRMTLPRREGHVEAQGQDWPIKAAERPDGTTTAKLESDSLLHVAGLHARRRLARAAEEGGGHD
ncbi:MAG TPA: LarC family nickel insertion protein [Mesorhizobium sp.]|jgi:hypothetical protein|nr:LarC family nickel insertion protein [Mesorhizobium sp.]